MGASAILLSAILATQVSGLYGCARSKGGALNTGQEKIEPEGCAPTWWRKNEDTTNHFALRFKFRSVQNDKYTVDTIYTDPHSTEILHRCSHPFHDSFTHDESWLLSCAHCGKASGSCSTPINRLRVDYGVVVKCLEPGVGDTCQIEIDRSEWLFDPTLERLFSVDVPTQSPTPFAFKAVVVAASCSVLFVATAFAGLKHRGRPRGDDCEELVQVEASQGEAE